MNISKNDGDVKNLIDKVDSFSESSKQYEEAMNDTEKMCIMLTLQPLSFRSHETIEMLLHMMRIFLRDHKRLWYFRVSRFIFSKSEKEVGTMLTNLEWLIYKLYDNRFPLEYKLEGAYLEDLKNIRITFSKLYDHVNLAAAQKQSLSLDKNAFKEEFDSCFAKSSGVIVKEMDERLASNSNNVISLIALFTAMAFLVFGGLTSFESILSNMHQVSILKLIVLSCVWGLGILNAIAVFMFFISKTVGKSFAHASTKNSTLFNRYPYIILGNFILLATFIMSSWMYFCVRNSGENKVLDFSFLDTSNITVVAIGSIVVVQLIFVLYFLLFRYAKTETDPSKQSTNETLHQKDEQIIEDEPNNMKVNVDEASAPSQNNDVTKKPAED